MDITLQEAADTDLPAILSLYAQLGQDDGAVLGMAEAQRIFARIRTYPDYRIYVARSTGGILGTFALLIMDNIAHMGTPSAILENVVVREDMRSQGVGQQMVRFAGCLCRNRGCYKMSLTSNRNREDAHRFYESLGYQIHGYSFYISCPGAKEDSGTAPKERQQ